MTDSSADYCRPQPTGSASVDVDVEALHGRKESVLVAPLGEGQRSIPLDC